MKLDEHSFDYNSQDVDDFQEDNWNRNKGYNLEKEEAAYIKPFFYNEELKSSQAKVLAKFVLKQLGFT